MSEKEFTKIEINLRRAVLNIVLLSSPIIDNIEYLEKYSANKIWSKQTKFYGNQFKQNLEKQLRLQTELWAEGSAEHLYVHIELIERFSKEISKLTHIDNHEDLEKINLELSNLFNKYAKL